MPLRHQLPRQSCTVLYCSQGYIYHLRADISIGFFIILFSKKILRICSFHVVFLPVIFSGQYFPMAFVAYVLPCSVRIREKNYRIRIRLSKKPDPAQQKNPDPIRFLQKIFFTLKNVSSDPEKRTGSYRPKISGSSLLAFSKKKKKKML